MYVDLALCPHHLSPIDASLLSVGIGSLELIRVALESGLCLSRQLNMSLGRLVSTNVLVRSTARNGVR